MACTRHRVSERRACRVLGQARTTQRYEKRVREDEGPLRALIVQLACDYGGYGVPRILDLLRRRGWQVNRKRLEEPSTRPVRFQARDRLLDFLEAL